MKQHTQGNKIASRMWAQQLHFYVQHVPGDGGCDWGYTTDYTQALPLNVYFQRRFTADCTRCNSLAQFTEV